MAKMRVIAYYDIEVPARTDEELTEHLVLDDPILWWKDGESLTQVTGLGAASTGTIALAEMFYEDAEGNQL